MTETGSQRLKLLFHLCCLIEAAEVQQGPLQNLSLIVTLLSLFFFVPFGTLLLVGATVAFYSLVSGLFPANQADGT